MTELKPGSGSQGDEFRYPELDGLRAIAILQVVIYHYLTTIPSSSPDGTLLAGLRELTGTFWAGVDLFFVLSGFLVGCAFERDLRHPRPLASFYLRRVYRIIPLYAISILCALLIDQSGGLNTHNNLTATNFPYWSYILAIQNFAIAQRGDFGGLWLAPTWSLALEEQFYILLPLMMLYLKRPRLIVLIFVVVLIAPFLRALHSFPDAYVLPYCRADSLFVGLIIALVWRGSWFQRAILDSSRFARVMLALALSLMLPIYAVGSPAGGPLNHLGLACAFGLLLVLVISGAIPMLNAMLRVESLLWIGMRAYPIYLFHYGIVSLVFSLFGVPMSADGKKAWALIALSTLATFVVSAMMHRFVEAPMQARGKRIVRLLRKRVEVSV